MLRKNQIGVQPCLDLATECTQSTLAGTAIAANAQDGVCFLNTANLAANPYGYLNIAWTPASGLSLAAEGGMVLFGIALQPLVNFTEDYITAVPVEYSFAATCTQSQFKIMTFCGLMDTTSIAAGFDANNVVEDIALLSAHNFVGKDQGTINIKPWLSAANDLDKAVVLGMGVVNLNTSASAVNHFRGTGFARYAFDNISTLGRV